MAWVNDRFYYSIGILKRIAENYANLYSDASWGSLFLMAESKADFDRALSSIGRGKWSGIVGYKLKHYKYFGRLQQVVIAFILGIKDKEMEKLGFQDVKGMRSKAFQRMRDKLNGRKIKMNCPPFRRSTKRNCPHYIERTVLLQAEFTQLYERLLSYAYYRAGRYFSDGVQRQDAAERAMNEVVDEWVRLGNYDEEVAKRKIQSSLRQSSRKRKLEPIGVVGSLNDELNFDESHGFHGYKIK